MPRLALDDIPQTDVVEPGFYRLQVMSLTYGESKASGRAKYDGQFQIVDGPGHKGRYIFETYVFGTPDDPIPENDIPLKYVNERGETVENIGAKLLGRLLRWGLNLPHDDDLDLLCEEAVDKVFDAKVTIQPESDGYPPKNRISEYGPEGSKELGLIEARTATAKRTPTATTGRQRQSFSSGHSRTRRTPEMADATNDESPEIPF